jgi:hypothetical protein
MNNFTDRLANPYNFETRLNKVEDTVRRLWLRNAGSGGAGGGGPIYGTDTGVGTGANVPEIASVSQPAAASSDFTPEGAYVPQLTVIIGGDKEPPIGAIGYVLKVTPDGAASYEERGPEYNPDTGVLYPALGIITIKRPPFGLCAIQARLRTIESEGEYGPAYTFTVGADTTTPPAVTNLTAVARMNSVGFSFDLPVMDNYLHTEVWKGIGDFNLSGGGLGVPVIAATNSVGTGEFPWDNAQDGTASAYDTIKARHVDKAGNYGPLCAGETIVFRLTDETQLASVIDYAGTLNVAGGKVSLGPDGLRVQADATEGANNVTFEDEAGVDIGSLYSFGLVSGGTHRIKLSASNDFDIETGGDMTFVASGAMRLSSPFNMRIQGASGIQIEGPIQPNTTADNNLDLKLIASQSGHFISGLDASSNPVFRIDKAGVFGTYIGTTYRSGPELFPLHNYQGAPPYSAATEALAGGVPGNYPFQFERWDLGWYVGGTNDGSNYWEIRLRRLDSSVSFQNLASIFTSSLGPNVWQKLSETSFTNNPTATSDIWVQVYVEPVGSPGSIYIQSQAYGRFVY